MLLIVILDNDFFHMFKHWPKIKDKNIFCENFFSWYYFSRISLLSYLKISSYSTLQFSRPLGILFGFINNFFKLANCVNPKFLQMTFHKGVFKALYILWFLYKFLNI